MGKGGTQTYLRDKRNRNGVEFQKMTSCTKEQSKKWPSQKRNGVTKICKGQIRRGLLHYAIN